MAGENGQVRYGLESSEGFSWVDSWFTPFISENFRMNRPSEANPNITGSGRESRGDNLEASGTGTLLVAMNTEDLLPIRAHMHGYYEVVQVVAGVYRWTFRDFDELEDVAIAHYLGSLWFGLWRDQRDNPSEYRIFGAKASQFEITQDAFQHIRGAHDFLFLRDTYSRVDELVPDANFTGLLDIDGHRILGDENGDYFKFKITTPGDFDTARAVFGKGVAAYGATEYDLATIMDMMNANDTRYAPRDEPYRLKFVEGGTFLDNKEWRIYPTSPKPVAVLSQRPLLRSSKLEIAIVINGVTMTSRPIEQFTITDVSPREAIGGVGSKYYQTIDRPNEGRRYWEVSFQSIYLDRVMEQALISGALADASVKFYGGYIGATGLEDYAEFTLDDMWFTEAGTEGVTQPGRLPESVTLRGSSCTEVYQNTIASIAPSEEGS